VTIKPGQTYRSVGDPYPYDEPRRIKVVSEPQCIPGIWNFGKVTIVTITATGRETRRRAIEMSQLHDSPLTRDGQPRHTGYALEQP
jgi:hypothetical protein